MNEKEKETVKQVKKYLMELRKINLERLSLTFEIEDIPSPSLILKNYNTYLFKMFNYFYF